MKTMVGLRLKAARQALGLDKQGSMATMLGVGTSTYNNWELGIRLAPVSAMVRLYVIAGVSLDWIYAGDLRGMSMELGQKLRSDLAKSTSTPAELTFASPPPARAGKRGKAKASV